jgi:hypothetical protein
MKNIYVSLVINGNKKKITFRTNESGNYLFVGTSENKQISCDSGFGNNRFTRKYIRGYISNLFSSDPDYKLPRISYSFVI